jgi:hypothetical protein
MFPPGLPGAALFLLRVGIVGMLFDSTLQNSSNGNVNPLRIVALTLITILLLCGAFTPIAGILSIIFEAMSWSVWNGLRSFEFFLQALVMIALVLLGPGAYSIDSKMFGRRLILPPE